MGADIKRQNEVFQADYDKIYAKGTWTDSEVARMKDYKKLIYYNLAVCAMEEGEGHPGEGYLPEMSGARGRDPMTGRYMSRDSGLDNWNHSGSGMYYDGGNSSYRRYYDGEKEKAVHQLHRMMENTDDPERKNALRFAITMAEQQR